MDPKECKHAHCKCMNIGGQCSNYHYATCNLDYIEWQKHQEDEQKYRVVENMAQYGGSFVKALAQAFYAADPINFIKLKRAFPEYWKEYSDPKLNVY